MPKISKGGVSNRIVDPDYIAPSGMPPEVGLDIGAPDMGKPEGEQWPGKNSPESSEQPKPTTSRRKNAKPTPSTAPTTTGH